VGGEVSVGGWRLLESDLEWYSGRRVLERPARLRLAGATVDLTVEEGWVEGPAFAGGPLTRRFVVRDPDRRRFRISATSGRPAIVEVESPG